MVLTSPLFLLLLLFLPLLLWLGRPARGPSRRREIVSLALRLLIALLLVAGLAGLEIRRSADELSVIFLVDASDSMSVPVTIEGSSGPVETTPKQIALSYVRQALLQMGPRDKAGVILFGGDAVVERSLSDRKELESFTSKVVTLQTDLAGAIRLGLALLPADTARRMVILSDGIQTSGDAFEAARLAAASGTQIAVVPFGVTGGAEALLTDVQAPARLRQGEEFSLEITINSTVDQTVGLRVLAGAVVAYEGRLQLRRGVHAYSLPLVAGPPGFAAYRVQIIPLTDVFYQNNEMAAFSLVEGPPKVLLVKNQNPRDGVDETRELIAALQASNILADVVPASGLPSELPALSDYASVILVDVPARDLSTRQMESLRTYVRDLGGGLVAVGGPTAYGVGGWYRTPIEEALPVEMQIKDQKRRAGTTIVFIVDKSGSMADTSGGAAKVELAKEAVIRSVELLSPIDKVGVIAFDDSASWVVPITPLDNPDNVVNRVGSIRADGGTDIMAGVRLASMALPLDDSPVRHIILLTDGGADPTGIPELVAQMYNDHGITLSSVAVGRDAAQDLLRRLAEAGGGVYHFADDPATIPTIFAEETALATRSYIIEEEFFPQQTSPSPILSGIESVPALLGYVGTTSKEAAQTILISAQEDPILAAWQYGLGKSAAWTSDATGRWAKNWVSWDEYARFWAQIVRYTIGQGAPSNTTVQVTREGETATLVVDARSDAGAFLNGLTVQANVVDPDGNARTVTLQQVAPGRYEAAFTPTAEGAYLIRVAGSDPSLPSAETASVAQTAGWVLSYSPEYQTLASNPNLLAQVAQLAGGASVADDFEAIFRHDLEAPARATRPIWLELFTLAVLLLPLDIAMRRLVVTRYDLQRARLWVRVWIGTRAPQPAPQPRAERMSALFKAKDRAGVAPAKGQAESVPAPPPIVTKPLDSAPPVERPGPSQEPSVTASPRAAPPPASTSAALLAKKRAREKKE
jgi:uncharacterized membrane protein